MAASQSRARCFLQETNSRCMEERRIVTSSEWSLISAGNCQEFWLSGRRLLIQFTANSSSPTDHVPHSQLHSKAPCGKWRSNRTHRYKFPPMETTATKGGHVLLHVLRILSPRTCNKKLHKTTQLPLTPSSQTPPNTQDPPTPSSFSTTNCTQIQRFPGKEWGKYQVQLNTLQEITPLPRSY